MIEKIAKRLAFRAAQISGDPLLTGEEEFWYSLSGRDQRLWTATAGEAIETVQKGGGL